MTQTAKNPNSTARLIIVLFLISAITALALGLVNYVTAPRIAAIEAEKSRAAMEEVLPAESYEEVSYTAATAWSQRYTGPGTPAMWWRSRPPASAAPSI